MLLRQTEQDQIDMQMQQIKLGLETSEGTQLYDKANSELEKMVQKFEGSDYLLPSLEFVGGIGYNTRDGNVILEAIHFASEKPEQLPYSGKQEKEGCMAFKVPHIMSYMRANGPDSSFASIDTAIGFINVGRSYSAKVLSEVLLNSAEDICIQGDNALSRYLQIMNQEAVVKGINEKKDFDLDYFYLYLNRNNVIKTREGGIGAFADIAKVNDPEILEFSERIAKCYGLSDLATAIMSICQAGKLTTIKGEELSTTANCISDVAAKTLDEQAVMSVVEVASNYELIELEEIMKTIQKNTSHVSEALVERRRLPYKADFEAERAEIADYVKLMADAFNLDSVKKLGPYCRESKLKFFGSKFAPGAKLDESEIAALSVGQDRSGIFLSADCIGEIVVRTKSTEAIESVVKTLFAETDQSENALLIQKAKCTNDVEIIKMMANYVLDTDTNFILGDKWDSNPGSLAIAQQANARALYSMDSSIALHKPYILKKAIEIASAYKDSTKPVLDFFLMVAERYAGDKERILEVGDDLLNGRASIEDIKDCLSHD